MLNDILDERKRFKHQTTLKVVFKKYEGTEIEFSGVYFNLTTKIGINHKFDLDKFFQKILYRIYNWANEESGWIVKSVKSQYTNISTLSDHYL